MSDKISKEDQQAIDMWLKTHRVTKCPSAMANFADETNRLSPLGRYFQESRSAHAE